MSRRSRPIAAVTLLAAFVLPGASAARITISSESISAFQEHDIDIPFPETHVLGASQDTFLDQKHKNTNYGSQTQFAITKGKDTVSVGGTDIHVENARLLISFDVSAVCVGAVSSATLTITGPSSNNTIGIQIAELTSSWDEMTATWHNSPDDSRIDQDTSVNIVGGDAIASFDVTSTLVDSQGRFDPTTDAAVNGWTVKDARNSVWYSRSWSDTTLRPSLTIEIASC